MSEFPNDVWKDPEVVRRFVSGRMKALPLAADQARVLLRLLAGTGRPIERFADVGCGGGRVGLMVLDGWPQAQAVFADFSQPMLDAAREAVGERAGKARFVQADFADEGFGRILAPHGPFDAVVSGFAIHHLPHPRKREIYAEIFDLLAPGGIFVNMEHVASSSTWGEGLHDEAFVESAHSAGAFEGKSYQQALDEYAQRPDRQANVLLDLQTQLDWLRQIGYADVDCFFKYFELSVFAGRKPGEPG